MAKFAVFKSIDEFVFEKCRELKQTPQYVKLTEFLTEVPDDYQPHVKVSIFVLIILIPLSILGYLFYSNYSTRVKISQKKEIIQLATGIKDYGNSLKSVESKVSSNLSSSDEQGIAAKLRTYIFDKNITDSIFYTDTEISDLSARLSRVKTTVNFSKLNTSQFIMLVSTLSNKLKARVDSIEINKDDKTKVLAGKFEVVLLNISGQ
jgi:hypothetical protein